MNLQIALTLAKEQYLGLWILKQFGFGRIEGSLYPRD